MPVKVKRGLGLLVVALVAWLAVTLLVQTTSTVLNLAALPIGLVGFVAAGVGVVLLAWGLLRD
jgi:hypothetical protein